MLLALREEVEATLARALADLDLPADDLAIEEPPEDVDAVLASSVAFRVAGAAEAPPPEVAADLAAAIDAADCTYVGEVHATGPYLNFAPSTAFDAETLDAAREDDYGHLDPRDERVVVEHTSSNPTGPIHVGRSRNTIIGDALANVVEWAGYDVERHFYVNDAGRQIAVLTWAVETFGETDLPEPERDRADYDLVRYYRAGNDYLETADPADADAAETEIEAIIHGLEDGDDEVYERVQAVVGEMLSGMTATLERLPAEFDEFVHETRFMRDGSTDDVVARLKESDHAVYEDEAWQLELDDWGIDKNFVFLRSDGTTLYTTRDLAHHEWKFANFDRAVTVLGEDQALHADQLRAALEILGNDTDPLTEVLYGWVTLPDEDMSTRKGTGVDLDDLLDEAIDRARREVEDRVDVSQRADLTEADVERIARQVGVGAVRYDIVAKQPTKAITFRWEEALDFEAQSAPYVQYVHARACGILEAAAEGIDAAAERDEAAVERDAEPATESADVEALTEPEALALLRTVARFPAVVEGAAGDLAPHRVATYTRDLAEAFNAFYRECPVLDAEDPAVRDARLAVTAAARTTVANALSILGVAAPERM